MVITIEDLRKNETKLCGSFLKMVDHVKAMAGDPSEQQLLLTRMVLEELMMNKNIPEAAFSLGFPKKKRFGSRRQNQKKKIIIKFKRCVSAATGIASYSCPVSSDNGDVVTYQINDDQKQKQEYLKLNSMSNKRCYSEIGEAANQVFQEFKSKRLMNSQRVLPCVQPMTVELRKEDVQDGIVGMSGLMHLLSVRNR